MKTCFDTEAKGNSDIASERAAAPWHFAYNAGLWGYTTIHMKNFKTLVQLCNSMHIPVHDQSKNLFVL